VVTICASRKTIPAEALKRAVSLPVGPQKAIETAWLERLASQSPSVSAQDLYQGRGFALAREAARIVGSPLFVVSAGLGLVAATHSVPSYGLTVSKGQSDSIGSRVTDSFDVVAWFSALMSGPYSLKWTDISAAPGRILLCLTRPYAAMVGESLLKLSAADQSRLRIFGAAIAEVLPLEFRRNVVPYDSRLDTIFPGTRADFSPRALRHFVGLNLSSDRLDRDADFAAVEAALKNAKEPERIIRARRSDEEISELISVRLGSQGGIARILRALRQEDGIACEQSRFSRLYRDVVQRRSAA
jgi:hypothetical protein